MARLALLALIACAAPPAPPDDDDGSVDIRIDGAGAPDPDSFDPLLCVAPDGRVHVGWLDDRDGAVDLWWNQSAVGGDAGSWLEVPLRVNDGQAPVSHAALACDTGDAWFAWVSAGRVYASGPIEIGGTAAIEVDLVRAGDTVAVFWSEADGTLWTARSVTSGASWLSPERLAETGRSPRGVAPGGIAGAAWIDDRDGAAGIYFRRADGTPEIRLDAGDDPGTAASDTLAVCADGEEIHAVWSDRRNGEPDVYLISSTDGGRTWDADPLRLDGPKDWVVPAEVHGDPPGSGSSTDPRCVATPAAVHVAWSDVVPPFVNADVYARSVRDGVPDARARRLDTGDGDLPAGLAASLDVRIAADPLVGMVAIVWREARNGSGGDLYYTYGDVYGVLGAVGGDVRLDTADSSLAIKAGLGAAVLGNAVYATWIDERSDSDDVYFARRTFGADEDE